MTSEREVIAAAVTPVTRSSLAAELVQLGVARGGVLAVHSSLSRLGWVIGGAQAVVEALLDVIGPTGTLVMQSHTSVNSDPAAWENPPVPEAWWQTIRDHMPAYDPALSGVDSMGAIVECFLRVPGVRRSGHPAESCAAFGPLAEALTCDHIPTPAFGAGSPLNRLVDHDAQLLLLGVDHGNDTLLHYAEHLAEWPTKASKTFGSAMIVDGERRWVSRVDLDPDSDDFAELGEAFAATGREARSGAFRLCRAVELIDFAVPWLSRRRCERADGETPAA
jgi:aminoglycoside 3-N-acetyltransferase